jgi:hypothetical protein
MTTLLDSLRQYCMSEKTFDETDFRRVMEGVLRVTPNLTRLKLNLPFQVIGRASRTATLLLATTFACFRQRPTEFTSLETLVLDHVSDSTILDICQNPIDLGNALHTFKYLKNLVISIKRQESSTPLMDIFSNRLWFLISEAEHLDSLCITGWNVKTSGPTRRRRARADLNDWMMKSLPYSELDKNRCLKHLRYLELRRIDIDPIALEKLIEQNSTSLKELYLNDVYLKVFESPERQTTALWIGHGGTGPKPLGSYWLADNLRNMESLNLDVLRVAGLGYNDFDPSTDMQPKDYDFKDPSGLDRPFEQRFVEAVLGHLPPSLKPMTAIATATACPRHLNGWRPSRLPILEGQMDSHAAFTRSLLTQSINVNRISTSPLASETMPSRERPVRKVDYDVETFQRFHNTTSHWKCSIDGLFYNHNEKALVELQKIISVADRGMALLSEEITRIHSLSRIPVGGEGLRNQN